MPQIGSLAVPWSPFVGAGPSRTAVLVCIVLLPSAPGELVEVEQLADNGVLASLLDALHDAALQVVLGDQRLQLLDGPAHVVCLRVYADSFLVLLDHTPH